MWWKNCAKFKHSSVELVKNLSHYLTATLDGGVGYLLPVPEKTYRRLLMLQTKLVQGLPHTAGLNPKAFRLEFLASDVYL